jgi:hypothetical protein
MNAMRKTDSLTDVIHTSIDGIHLVCPDAAQDGQKATVPGRPAPCVTALAAERITAAVLLVMCIAAAVFV